MKKMILVLVAVALAGGIQASYAQGRYKSAEAAADKAESIISSFSGSRDADVLSIGSLLINLVRPFAGDSEAKAVLKMAKGLIIADMEDCSADVKDSFSSQMSNYIDSLGELKLMEVRDGEDNVIVIGDENKVSGMLVCGKEEAVLIKLCAKPEELMQLMQVANN